MRVVHLLVIYVTKHGLVQGHVSLQSGLVPYVHVGDKWCKKYEPPQLHTTSFSRQRASTMPRFAPDKLSIWRYVRAGSIELEENTSSGHCKKHLLVACSMPPSSDNTIEQQDLRPQPQLWPCAISSPLQPDALETQRPSILLQQFVCHPHILFAFLPRPQS